MALTITSPVTSYNVCDSTAGTSGVDTIDADEQIEGSGTWASDVDIETDIMLGPAVTAIDMDATKYAVYPWVKSFTASYLDLKANGGLFGVLSDGTNSSYYYLNGSDTYPGGFEVMAFSSDAVEDGNSGTAANLAAITRIGVGFKGVSKSKLPDNSFTDWIRYSSGTALKVTGTVTTTNVGWAEVLSGDTTLIAGIIKEQTGSYVIKGPIDIGDSTGTLATTFSDANSVVIFDNSPVGENHHAISGIGNATGATSITLTNQTFIGSGGRFLWDQTATNLNTFVQTGGAMTHAGAVSFKAGQTVTGVVFTDALTLNVANELIGCTVADSGLLTIASGGGLTDCIIDGAVGAVAVTAPSPADAENVTGTPFTSGGTGNGLEITGTAANFTLTNVDFTGYSLTVDANKAIYVNIASGSLTLSITGGSGVTADSHVRTAGCVVTVEADPVTTQYTVINTSGAAISGARVFLETSDDTGPLPFEKPVTITQAAGLATVAHTGHNIPDGTQVVIRGADQNGYNKVAVITVVDANSYTYAVDAGTATPSTGTEVASGVLIHTTTNGSGIVSDTRVLSSSQPFKGAIRDSSGSPYHQAATVTGTVSNTTGFSATIALLSDE